MRRVLSYIACFLLLAGAVTGIAHARRARLDALERREGGEVLRPLPDGRSMRIASFGYRCLAADLFWLAAIQHYGTAPNPDHGFPQLYPLLDLVTELDPAFAYAYRFGGVAIPYSSPTGRLLNADKAVVLLEKGLRNLPQSWQIGLLLGFTRFWYLNDAEGGAEALEAVANAPGRPAFLPLLATRLRSHAGSPEMALSFAERLARETQEPEIREEMERRVEDLRVEVLLRRIESALARFREVHGSWPPTLAALERDGFLVRTEPERDIPVVYEPARGVVSSPALPRRVQVAPHALRDAAKDRGEPPPSETTGESTR